LCDAYCRCTLNADGFLALNSLAFLIDFGSTYTKVVAVDLRTAEVIGRSQAASTVNTDVREGLMQALVTLHDTHVLFTDRPADLTALEDNLGIASSSAAGGLRMAGSGRGRGVARG